MQRKNKFQFCKFNKIFTKAAILLLTWKWHLHDPGLGIAQLRVSGHGVRSARRKRGRSFLQQNSAHFSLRFSSRRVETRRKETSREEGTALPVCLPNPIRTECTFAGSSSDRRISPTDRVVACQRSAEASAVFRFRCRWPLSRSSALCPWSSRSVVEISSARYRTSLLSSSS